MSLTVIVTLHCDGCSLWVYTADSSARERWKAGWTSTYDTSVTGCRRDHCPTCTRLKGPPERVR